jgi:hypothetical protein
MDPDQIRVKYGNSMHKVLQNDHILGNFSILKRYIRSKFKSRYTSVL